MSSITGEVQWACVQEPNTKFTPCYTIDVLVSKEEADLLIQESKEVALAKGITSTGIKLKKEEDGRFRFKVSRDVLKADGETLNKVPMVRDRRNRDFKDLIGNGSICKVLYNIFTWKNKYGEGLGVDLQGTQVLELVSYGGGVFQDEGESSVPVDSATNKEFDDEGLD